MKYPTFIFYGCNPSILDHIWGNLPYSSKCTVFSTPIPDHIPFIASFDVATKLPDIQLKFRDFSTRRMKLFKNEILAKFENFYRELFFTISSIDERFEFLFSWLEAACDYFSPIRSKRVSHKRFASPWITTTLIQLIRKKTPTFQTV